MSYTGDFPFTVQELQDFWRYDPDVQKIELMEDGKPPRPRNKWLIFRNVVGPLAQNAGYGFPNSRLFSYWWHPFKGTAGFRVIEQMAAEELATHKRLFPNYKYKPTPKGKRRPKPYGRRKLPAQAPRKKPKSPSRRPYQQSNSVAGPSTSTPTFNDAPSLPAAATFTTPYAINDAGSPSLSSSPSAASSPLLRTPSDTEAVLSPTLLHDYWSQQVVSGAEGTSGAGADAAATSSEEQLPSYLSQQPYGHSWYEGSALFAPGSQPFPAATMSQAGATGFQQQATESISSLSGPEGELSNEFFNLDFLPNAPFDQKQPAFGDYGEGGATAWSALTSAFGDEFGQSSTAPMASWGDLPSDQGDELSAHKPPFWPTVDAYGSSYEEGSMASFDAFPTMGTGYGGFSQYPLNDSFFENTY